MPLEFDISDSVADLMTQVVTIEVLPDPQPRSRAGAPKETGQWIVERADVPCLIIPRSTTTKLEGMAPVCVTQLKILFDAAVELGPRRRILYADPVRGQRVFRPDEARNVAELGQVWIADAQEITG